MGFSLSGAVKKVTGGASKLLSKGGSALGGVLDLSSIGTLLNNATGATSASKQEQKYAKEMAAINQKYALESARINNQYQKEFAQNAHQWEIEDLKAAGLNPVLSAGGDGASASGGGVGSGSATGAGVSSAGINPIETAINAWNGYEQAINTGADTERKNADVANINQDTILKYWQTLTEMEKGTLNKAEREKIEAEKSQIVKMTPAIFEKTRAETRLINKQKRKMTTVKEGHGEAGISLGILGKFGAYGSGGSTN